MSDKLTEKLNMLAQLVQKRERSDGTEFVILIGRIRRIKAEVKELRRKEAAGEKEQEGLF